MQSAAQITYLSLSSFPSLLPLLPFVLNALCSLNSIAIRSCLIADFRLHQQKPECEASNCRLEVFAYKPLDMQRLVVLQMRNFYSAFCTMNNANHCRSKFCDSNDILFHKTSRLSRVLLLLVLTKQRHKVILKFCTQCSAISYISLPLHLKHNTFLFLT